MSHSEETPNVWPHMQDGKQQKVKDTDVQIVDRTNKRSRPCREWMEDIVSWWKTGLQEVNSLAQDRRRWKLIKDKQCTPWVLVSWFLEKKIHFYNR